MTEFFACDGSIESSKLVISEALNRGPDLGNFLRGGPFASSAQVYRNLSSKFDFDAAYFLCAKNKAGKTSNFGGSGKASNTYQYPIGYCFKFQKSAECNVRTCLFKHYCATCEATDHGADTCRKRARRNRDDERQTNRSGTRESRENRDRENANQRA